MSTQHQDAAMALQKFVVRLGLPKMGYALFGVKCPYCGKMDRVFRLEAPDKLKQLLDAEAAQTYAKLWHTQSQSHHSIGVCKYCHNLLNLNGNTNAVPLAE